MNIYFLFCGQLPATDRGDGDRMGRGENRTRLNSFTDPASVCFLGRADIVFTALSPLSLFPSFNSEATRASLTFPFVDSPRLNNRQTLLNFSSQDKETYIRIRYRNLDRGSPMRVIFFFSALLVNLTRKFELLQNHYSPRNDINFSTKELYLCTFIERCPNSQS